MWAGLTVGGYLKSRKKIWAGLNSRAVMGGYLKSSKEKRCGLGLLWAVSSNQGKRYGLGLTLGSYLYSSKKTSP
jgi:hypothetical protein